MRIRTLVGAMGMILAVGGCSGDDDEDRLGAPGDP
jgi:hypothetical protein